MFKLLKAELIRSKFPLSANIQREAIKIGGVIDEDEFNLAYVRQADLIANVLDGNKVYEYSPEEMESMESTLINITRGGK